MSTFFIVLLFISFRLKTISTDVSLKKKRNVCSLLHKHKVALYSSQALSQMESGTLSVLQGKNVLHSL